MVSKASCCRTKSWFWESSPKAVQFVCSIQAPETPSVAAPPDAPTPHTASPLAKLLPRRRQQRVKTVASWWGAWAGIGGGSSRLSLTREVNDWIVTCRHRRGGRMTSRLAEYRERSRRRKEMLKVLVVI